MGSERKVLVFQHVDCEGPGVFGRVAPQACVRLSTVHPSKSLPHGREMAGISGLIVLGGPMGVYESDRHAWIAREVELVGEAVRAGKPVIGLCLGSQILAAALGARVYPHDHKEIGWDDIELAPAARQDPLFCDLPSPLKVFHWHSDTFDLPAGAIRLASSRLCRNQAFRFGKRAWGLQCHLEIERADPLTWAGIYREEVEKTGAPTTGVDFGRDTDQHWPPLQPVAQKVAERFFSFCSGA